MGPPLQAFDFNKVVHVPDDNVYDSITPHKISLLVLITHYLSKSHGSNDVIFTQKDRLTKRQRTSFMMLLLDLVKTPDMNIDELIDMIKPQLKTDLTQSILSRLKELAHSNVSQFYDFFDKLNDPVKEYLEDFSSSYTVLNRTSVLGIFIRSMVAAFKVQSYESIRSSILKDFHKYYMDSSMHARYHSRPLIERLVGKQSAVPSSWQAKKYLLKTAFLLEHNENAAGTAVEVENKVKQIAKRYPNLAEVHFVRFLNNVRMREHDRAADALHHYFVTCSLSQEPISSPYPCDNKSFRYASLNMVSLHLKFGHREQAVHALKEAIQLAQQANDQDCLSMSTVWLKYLDSGGSGHVKPTISANRDETKPLSRADDPLKHLIHIRNNFLSGRLPPKQMMQMLLKCKLLSYASGSRSSVLSFHSLSSQTWKLLGKREMGSLVAQQLLQMDTQEFGATHCAEVECLALCNLSDHHFAQGLYSLADSILNICKVLYPQSSQFKHIWNLTESCQMFDRARLHGDVKALSSVVDDISIIDGDEALLRRGVLHKLKLELGESHSILHGLYSKLKSDHTNATLLIRILLELIDLYVIMEDFSNTTLYIDICLKLCQPITHASLISLCQTYLAHTQLLQGDSKSAWGTISSVLPDILKYGVLIDQARARLLYTKCWFAVNIGQAGPGSREQQGVIEEVLSQLEPTLKMFVSCEAVIYQADCYRYKAILCSMMGDITNRNQAAFQLDQLSKQTSLTFTTDPIV